MFASGTVTQSFTPSKLNAEPNRPAALHAAPETVPTFPRPDESAAVEPGARVEPVRRDQAAGRSGGPAELLTVTVSSADGA